MPIINPRKRPNTRPEPAAPVPENDTVADTVPPASPQPKNTEHYSPASQKISPDKKGPSGVFYASALILGILLSIGGFFSYTAWVQTKIDRQIAAEEATEKERKSFDITNNLDIYEKVSALTSLTKREFEANTVALIETKKTPDSAVLISALEVIVNKNRQDLANYKIRLIEILLEINGFNALNAESVMEQITARTVDAGLRESSESVRLLNLLSKILEGAPEGTKLDDYFKVAIDDIL